MKKIIYILLITILLGSCKKSVEIVKIQNIKLDTTYTYKVKRKGGYLETYTTRQKYIVGDSIKISNLR